MENLITEYFKKGYQYKEILLFLEYHHGIKLCLRNLKYKLKEYGLKRRKINANEIEVLTAVDEYRKTFGESNGYRTIWHGVRLSGIIASREMVMLALRELDPDGCVNRKARRLKRRNYSTKGPNHIWHIDGYDKLKPFGFPIHGCIDGFSRRIIWLRCVKSNNDPFVVGKLYFDKICNSGRVPRRIRTDCGSENVFIAAAQTFFRRDDDEKAHIYGSSHHNQRIEAWWSQFRHMKTDYIINFFKEMVTTGEYNADDLLEKNCCRFCFGKLIKRFLDQCIQEWNSHYIRKSALSESFGRPDVLYFFPPENFNDEAISVKEEDVKIVCDNLSGSEVEEEGIYEEYFQYLSEELNLQEPTNLDVAKRNYLLLIQHAK